VTQAPRANRVTEVQSSSADEQVGKWDDTPGLLAVGVDLRGGLGSARAFGNDNRAEERTGRFGPARLQGDSAGDFSGRSG